MWPDHATCSGDDELIDSYLDNELSAHERESVEARALVDAEFRGELAAGRVARDVLRTTPLLRCPPGITSGVLAQARQSRLRDRLPGRTRPQRVWRPLLAAAVLIGVVLLSVVTGPRPGTNAESNAEVQTALDDIRMALGIVAGVTSRTADIVRTDVVEKAVLRNLLPGTPREEAE
jgi:anti-sigma factor RsiW